MYASSLVAFATLIGLVAGAPYLGHLYQPVDSYVYLNPEPVLYQPYQQVFGLQPYQQSYRQQLISPAVSTDQQSYQQQLISPAVSTDHQGYTVGPSSSGELTEMNQFHSEDAEGRVLYGFHGHNQARMEARDPQGRVRGSYSYLDPRGQVVRMDYWDDGSGFQARGSHIPKVTYEFPGFTPEVQAARDHHFKLYQQILLSTIHAQPPNKVHEEDYAYVERPDGAVSTPIGHEQEEEDDTVEVGLYPDNPEEMSYPGSMRLPGQSQQPTYPFQDQNEEDLESIALDNPELQDLGRGGKSLESKDTKQEGSNQQDKVQQLDKEHEKKHEETQHKSTTDKKTVDKTDNKMTTEEKVIKKEEMSHDNSDNKHDGFSYHFQYTLPAASTKIQTVPNFAKVSSVVASEPVPKDKKTSLHSVHPLPLHTMTSMKDDITLKTLPAASAHHDVQVAPHQAMLQRPIIIKSFLPPVSAVHDNQVPVKGAPTNNAKTESSQ